MPSPVLLALFLHLVVPPSQAQESEPATLALSPVYYELDVAFDFDDETLAGVARISLVNRSDHAVAELSLLLYRLMTVELITTTDRGDLPFDQQVTMYDDFSKLQVNHILAPLDPPLPPEDTLTVEVSYGGNLLGYAETGMQYIQDRISPDFTILRDDARAFPMPGYPSFAVNRSAPMPSYEYLARVTVPDTLVVANGGESLGVLMGQDTATYVYRSLVRSWRMDFAIARYETIDAPPIRIFHFPEDSVGAQAVSLAATAAFRTFERWFGPLADTTTLSFIEIPDGWGSQTDATAIIQAAAAFRDTTRHHEVYHEISHLWNVTPTDLPSPRWNEGLASFLEYLMAETLSGEPALTPRMDFLIHRLSRTLPSRPSWSTVPLVRYGEEGMTGLSYSAGALFFDQLYRMMGVDEFRSLIGDYYRSYNNSGGSTGDLVAMIRERVGTKADPLVEDWLFTTEWTNRIVEFPGVDALARYYGSAGTDH